jgi:hypothetical protein
MANIVIMPGGFHPFHAGHAALYNSIKQKYGEGSDIYVAASNNQKERPFPFEIKEKLAQLSGVQPGEFVQVKSPFVPKEITDKYDPDKDTIVFVRSEKDRNEYPKPGMTKKDGSPGYFQHIDTAQRGAQPFSKVGYMDYLPVKEFAGITSATQIRDTWPSLNDEQREEFITHIYPKLKGNDKLIKNVVKLLSKGMSLNEGLAYIDDKGNRVDYTRPDLPTDIENLVIDWFNDRDKYTKATLKQKGYTVDVDDKVNNIDVVDKKGRKYTVSVDDAMGKLIQQAYQEPINEAFVDPDQSKQYWNHDAQKIGVGGQIEFPLTDKPNLNGRRQGFNEGEERSIIRDAAIDALVNAFEGHADEFESREAIEANIYNELSSLDVEDIVDPEMDHHGQRMGNFASGRVIDVVDSSSVIDEVLQQLNYFDTDDDRNYVSESLNKIRGMIKETTDEQKSRSVDLHRKLFELMEEEKNNVVKLRGFGREADKPIPDINKVRAEKEREQERENNRYSEQRQKQDNYLTAIQEILFGLHEEFAEMEQLGLMPVELKDAFNNTTQLIDFISDYKDSEDQNNFPFTEEMLDKLHLKTVQLKEYFGGWRDTSAPRVLRKQTPRLDINSFWNTTDLSETADYIEEK